jgi:hypothetical protein
MCRSNSGLKARQSEFWSGKGHPGKRVSFFDDRDSSKNGGDAVHAPLRQELQRMRKLAA